MTEQKKMTESVSISKLSEKHRFGGFDSEFPELDDNTVWLYQLTLEAFIERNAPGMAMRQKTMLAMLCAQARRANKEDSGAQ